MRSFKCQLYTVILGERETLTTLYLMSANIYVFIGKVWLLGEPLQIIACPAWWHQYESHTWSAEAHQVIVYGCSGNGPQTGYFNELSGDSCAGASLQESSDP